MQGGEIIVARRALRRRRLAAAFPALLAAACLSSSGYGSEWPSQPPRLDGYSGQYTQLSPARAARLTPFLTRYGDAITLERFRGTVVLLNFWATWCEPCVYEMPSLDRLAAETDGTRLSVVPVSVDRAGLIAVGPFYREHGLAHLDIYLDPDQRMAHLSADNPHDAAFPLYGLPISYVIDPEGIVRGYITGAVDWQSDAAAALLGYYAEAPGE